jgi:hypothetical protein
MIEQMQVQARPECAGRCFFDRWTLGDGRYSKIMEVAAAYKDVGSSIEKAFHMCERLFLLMNSFLCVVGCAKADPYRT